MRKLEIDGIQLYEVKRKSGEPKPLVILLHGGFWHKDLEYAAGMATDEEVCMVTIDCAGSGESQDGPIQAPAAFMETVKDIDTLIEYYNTVPDVDAAKFGIMGHSMGGNIAMYIPQVGPVHPNQEVVFVVVAVGELPRRFPGAVDPMLGQLPAGRG